MRAGTGGDNNIQTLPYVLRVLVFLSLIDARRSSLNLRLIWPILISDGLFGRKGKTGERKEEEGEKSNRIGGMQEDVVCSMK